MKLMCYCGKQVSYETPFDDHHVQRIPCTTACRSTATSALQQTPSQINVAETFSAPRLSDSLTQTKLNLPPLGMLGH